MSQKRSSQQVLTANRQASSAGGARSHSPSDIAVGDDDDQPQPALKVRKTRITLSCVRCRGRKVKCDGVKPCENCRMTGNVCELPEFDGRKCKKSGRARETERPAVTHKVEFYLHDGGSGSDLLPWTGDPSSNSPAALAAAGSGAAGLAASFPEPGALQEWPTTAQAGPPLAVGNPAAPTIRGAHFMPDPVVPTHAELVSSQPRLADPPVTGDTLGVGAEDSVRCTYYRPFGPTAIQPGLEKISLSLKEPPSYSRAPSPEAQISPSSLNGPVSPPLSVFTFATAEPQPNIFTRQRVPPASTPESIQSNLFDGKSPYPKQEVLDELLPLFYLRLRSLFPFITPETVSGTSESSRTADISTRISEALLLNCICALSARFSASALVKRPEANRSPATYGIPFADRAKQLVMPLLGYPSPNTVAGLLLLAYHQFGLNDESSLWMYSGMALRMAVDLGLHLELERAALGKAATFGKLLWWSCFMLDRTLSLGTGRPLTIKDSDITVALPTDEDLAELNPGWACTNAHTPWAAAVRLMSLYGQISERVNVPSAFRQTLSEPPSRMEAAGRSGQTLRNDDADASFSAIEDAITETYNALPEDLTFSAKNLQAHVSKQDGPAFLHLHLWYHGMVILLHRPPLLCQHSSAAHLSLSDRLTVVNNSCLAISHILNSADLVDTWSYAASPFVNQCFFVAARSWVQDYRIRTGRDALSERATNPADAAQGMRSSTSILAQIALSNFKVCAQALSLQSKYWSGVSWVAAVLERLAERKGRTSIQVATEGLETFVSRQEMAVFKKVLNRSMGTTQSPSSLHNDDELLKSLLSAFTQQPQSFDFSQDDWAFAYSLAGDFPEYVHSGS